VAQQTWQTELVRIDDFITALPGLWDGADGHTSELPSERRHRELLTQTGGMASENKLAVLNLAAQYLADGEVYLEAGAWRGTSICAAALDNATGRFVTVDDFSAFGGPKDECLENIEKWAEGNVELCDQDIWTFLQDPPFVEPVGVFFYDAGHEFWDQWKALAAIEPLLADEALIVVDDASWAFVAAANTAFVRSHPRFQFVARYPMTSPNGPRWWNGLDVIAYRRVLPASDPALVRRLHAKALLRYGILGRAANLAAYSARIAPAKAKRFLRRLLSPVRGPGSADQAEHPQHPSDRSDQSRKT
jgi:predicted O-methyltransferase YrrM